MLDTTDYNPHGPFGDQTECNYKRQENRHSFRYRYSMGAYAYWKCEICNYNAGWNPVTGKYVYWSSEPVGYEVSSELPPCIPIVVN